MKAGLLAIIGITQFFSVTVRAETVIVTLEKDNALAVIDPIEGKLIKTVGRFPWGVVSKP